jgi:DNA-binding SARP family transcriptional activator
VDNFARFVVYWEKPSRRDVAHLALALLGPFQATLDRRPVEGLTSDRLRALLAYLAVEAGREHSREALAALLWPERPDRAALSALRYALSNLHHALGDRAATTPFLLVTRSTVQLNPAGDYWLDVAEFERLIAKGGWQTASGRGRRADANDSPSTISRLQSAVELYRGPFLEGVSVADSPAFDEWMLLKGEEHRRSLVAALGQLASLQAARGEHAEAARWARRQLELEPYREQAHRQLMLALALGGERSAALAHYDACRRVLAQELGCEPEDETQALYIQIREGNLPQPQLSAAILYPAPMAAEAAPPTQFVAREQQLSHLGTPLDRALSGQGGVALIAGEAGAGKTALLDEFARQAGKAHGDLIALRGSCNDAAGVGDPYLPFREMLQTLAGDVEGKRCGGTLSPEQARRIREVLPVTAAALVEHGPDLIDTIVPGKLLLQLVEGSPVGPVREHRQARLREAVRHAAEERAAAPGAVPGTPATQADLFSQVTRVLHAVALAKPLLLAIDDLQWADEGTTALLFHLGRRLAGSRILLACAYRPEALQVPPDFGSLGDSRSLDSVIRELTRQWGDVLVDLDRADGRAFVEAYVDSEPNCLAADFRRALYEHTGGNPLFTVELLRSFERDGSLVQDEAGRWMERPGLDWERWPPQVEAVIAGHLAGLPEDDRDLLQVASVQGELFAAEVAARVLGWDEEAAVRRLSGPLRTRHRLVEAVSLDRLALTGQRLSCYRFRHSFVQAGAYHNLDVVARARLHEATGRALEAIYAAEERPQTLGSSLARHYEAAGMRLPAARALHDAGRQAMALSAFREALHHFDHGLALLAGEPPSKERAEVERLLGLGRLGPQRNLAGLGASEVKSALAQVTAAGAGDAHGRPTLRMLQAEVELLTSKGLLEDALAVATRLLEMATNQGDEASAAGARYFMAMAYNLMGRLHEAEGHFRRLLAWLTPERREELRAILDVDPLSHTLAWVALDHWFLGYPEQALGYSNQALAEAMEQGDPYGQAFASALGSIALFLLRSDAAALQKRAELCHRLSREHGYLWWQAYSEVFLGRLAVARGEDTGIERMQSAIAAWQAQGMLIGTDNLSLVLADGCLAAAGRRPAGEAARAALLAAGLAAIEAVLGPPRLPCGVSYEAEVHRVRGELLLARDGLAAADEALACFELAARIGAEQGALAWELRAAMSLVRLCQSHGLGAELAEARQRLAAVYRRFTEGFAGPELQDAAALIGGTG